MRLLVKYGGYATLVYVDHFTHAWPVVVLHIAYVVFQVRVEIKCWVRANSVADAGSGQLDTAAAR